MKNTLAKYNEDAYLPSLHLSTVELRFKLQEKLHRVTWPLYSVELFVLKVDQHAPCFFVPEKSYRSGKT